MVDFKRKKLLIDKTFQTKLIFKVYIVILIVIFILAAVLLFSGKKEIVGSAIERLTKLREMYNAMLLKIIILSGSIALISLIAVGYIFLSYSHKIAGPMFRIKRVFQQVKKGDLSERVMFRSKDELKDIAVEFSEMMDVISDKLHLLKNDIDNLHNRMIQYKDSNKDIKPDEVINICKKVSSKINYFKF